MTTSVTTKPADATDLKCVVCQELTLSTNLYCHACQTPVEISQAVARRGTPARFLSILGPSGAGKTVYLGLLLDMLTQGGKALRGIPNGPFSLAIQQETVHALQNRRFPEKTRSEVDDWRWVHCEVSAANRPKQITDIITPDLAGEAISLELDRANTYPIIREIVAQSAGLLLLFDSQRARDRGRDEDLFGMKLVAYLANVLNNGQLAKWRRTRVPVAVVYTKADMCPEAFEDPTSFAEATMPGLVQSCRRHFARHRFCAAGIVGSYAMATDGYGRRSHMPLHVEPRGLLEPLEWIIGQ